MKKGKIARWLRHFHALEINQVAIYRLQGLLARTKADREMLKHMADNEAGHVRNLGWELQLRKLAPSPLLTQVAPLVGCIIGALGGLLPRAGFRSDVIFENMAMHYYQRFIDLSRGEKQLRQVLWANYMDESLHTEWFKARLDQDVDKVFVKEEKVCP